jgi:hypothetical protein
VGHHLLQPADKGGEAGLEADHTLDSGRLYLAGDGLALFEGQCQGLFAEEVFAGPGSGDALGGVQMVMGAQEHHIHLWVGQHRFRELCCLKNMLRKAVEWGYIESNPAWGVKQHRESLKEFEFLTSSGTSAFTICAILSPLTW